MVDTGDNASIARNADNSRKTAFAASRDCERTRSSHVGIVHATVEGSPDQARSTPPASAPSSYGEAFHEPQKPQAVKSITMAPSGTLDRTTGKSPSLSSASGLWEKLKRMRSKRSQNPE